VPQKYVAFNNSTGEKKSRQSEEFGLEVQKCEINQQLVNKSELNNEH